jgi:hypothetical protein
MVDANMRELAATGFMSNRGRQNVASWLALDAGVDWRLGRGVNESKHTTDIASPTPPPHVCIGIDPQQGMSCSDIGPLFLLNDSLARR